MRKKKGPYKIKQTIYLNVEGNTKEALEELCYKERKTLTEKLQELIDRELEQKNELASPNAIGIGFH